MVLMLIIPLIWTKAAGVLIADPAGAGGETAAARRAARPTPTPFTPA